MLEHTPYATEFNEESTLPRTRTFHQALLDHCVHGVRVVYLHICQVDDNELRQIATFEEDSVVRATDFFALDTILTQVVTLTCELVQGRSSDIHKII